MSTVRKLNESALRGIYDAYMHEAFPPAELKPLAVMLRLMERGRYLCYGYYRNGRLAAYADHFWLLLDGDKLVSFVDGMVSATPVLTDKMYEDPTLHDPKGDWQMIFGVNTIPDYRKRGCAGLVLERVIADAKAQGRKGLVLTCKDKLVHYYAKFGFEDYGRSESVHGGAVWYEMRLVF